jgi:hypothetical protein
MSADALTAAAWVVVLVSLTTGLVLVFGGSLVGRWRAARMEKAHQAGAQADTVAVADKDAANDPDRFTDAA